MLLKANKRRILVCPPVDRAPMIIENRAIYSIKGCKFGSRGENTSLIKVIKQDKYANGGISVKKPQIGNITELIVPMYQKWKGVQLVFCYSWKGYL